MFALTVFLYVPYEGLHQHQGPFLFSNKEEAAEAGNKFVTALEVLEPQNGYDYWSYSVVPCLELPNLEEMVAEAKAVKEQQKKEQLEAELVVINKSYIRGLDKLLPA